MIHESCFWLWLFYNNICFRLHTRIAEEIYWNWNYLRESGKKCFNLLFVEAIKNFLNETKKNQNLPCLSFHPNLIALSQLMNSANVFYSFFLFFFFFFAARAYQRKKEFSYGSYLLLVNSPNDLGFTVFCEHSWITKNEIQRTSLRQYH